MSRALIRANNTEKRNNRIKTAFYERYTQQPRPRKFSREEVLSQLGDEFCLAVGTVEAVLYLGLG